MIRFNIDEERCIQCGECAEDCPLRKPHNDLSIEEKDEYAQRLSDEEIKSILVHHESCYKKRLSDLNQW